MWKAKIHPLTPANLLYKKKVSILRNAIVATLLASLKAKGTTLSDYRTVNGQVGNYGEILSVYGQQGQPCPNCQTLIEKTFLAGRGTHFCPTCQK